MESMPFRMELTDHDGTPIMTNRPSITFLEPFYSALPSQLVITDCDKTQHCPVCLQQIRIRPCIFSKSHLLSLRLIEKATKVGVPVFAFDIGRELGRVIYCTYTQNKYWGLIQQDENGGWWLTPVGQVFLDGDAEIPEQLWIYNDAPVKVDGKESGHLHVTEVKMPDKVTREGIAQESVNLEANQF